MLLVSFFLDSGKGDRFKLLLEINDEKAKKEGSYGFIVGDGFIIIVLSKF